MMKRQLHRLSAKAVENQKRAGYFADGGGLYLQVTASRSKSWIFRYTIGGKSREMGLGSINAIGLSEARKRAADNRLLLQDGIDPIAARNAQSAQEALKRAKSVSFQTCADSYIAAHRAAWKNSKHAAQWKSTIKTYCAPLIGALPVQDVDTAMVFKVLEPIWTAKPETANRVRGRVESILDWASARGYRSGENPARWRGHLKTLLPAIKKDGRVRHHPALPYEQIGAFVTDLKSEEGTAARALEFAILCAARAGEVIDCQSAEFDLDKALWTIPGKRMKAGKEHRVPLAPRAVEIIRAQIKLNNAYIFPGQKSGKPLSNAAMKATIERMHARNIANDGKGWFDPKQNRMVVPHGFRSTFHDWAAEQTAFPSEVRDMALAHTVGDKVEAAYRRGDMFEKRRRLALEWAKYCHQGKTTGKVTVLRKAS